MPDLHYWFTGTSLYLATSFGFAIAVGLIGIREMVSRRLFYGFICVALVLSGFAWRTASKQESDAAAQEQESSALRGKLVDIQSAMGKIADALNVSKGQSAAALADQILAKIGPDWNLDPEQRKDLDYELTQYSPDRRFKVRILMLPSNSQSQIYGNELVSLFVKDHWPAEGISDLTLRPDLRGVSVMVPNGTKVLGDIPAQTRELMLILKSARLDFILRPPGTSTQWDSPAIAVGIRP